MDILIKLLLAHFIADFFLQWPTLLKCKNEKRFLSPYLYLHVFFHAALSLLLVWDLSLLPGIIAIVVSHTIFDGLKVILQNDKNRRWLFFIDQILHIAVIVLVASYYTKLDLLAAVDTQDAWLHVLFIVFLTSPVSIMIQTIFSRWELPDSTQESLADAGKYIGYLERILIYGAIVIGQWQIIGFLIATKSIFRFNDIKLNGHVKFTEYVLLGTLISFASAISAGILYNTFSA